ncbi:uncharacterized protein LOC143906733 [Temnothorax americanus]|uniref:uncharacterized protein LOC143906733 n=1 Tax=Temnothorax americanus TaxID=1964332 RepID=UPI0040697E4C
MHYAAVLSPRCRWILDHRWTKHLGPLLDCSCAPLTVSLDLRWTDSGSPRTDLGSPTSCTSFS